jgi:hypothetical protein
LADGSIKLPIGIVEDIPVQIGKFFVPIDFIIVDFDANFQTPLLLGRPFLNTAKAVINVYEGRISFKFGGEKVTFLVNQSTTISPNNNLDCRFDEVEKDTQEKQFPTAKDMPLERKTDDPVVPLRQEKIKTSSTSPPIATSLTHRKPPKPSIDALQGDSNLHKMEELLVKLEEIKKAFETTIEDVIQRHMLAQDSEEGWNVRMGAYKD